MLELNQLYNMDCMEGMKTFPDKYFDLAIVDPPYGIGMDGNKHPRGIVNYLDKRNNKRKLIRRNNYLGSKWDINPPNKKYFSELIRISKNQIIFGANHFISKISIDSPCWIVWDKANIGTHQSDAEIAWTSFKTAIRKFTFMWSGMIQGSLADGSKMQGNKKLNEKRIHPTQKPIQLYRWILHNYAKSNQKIIDTHAGSCSSVIAFLDYGCDWIAFEIDKDYYEAASKRIENHKMQLRLF